MSKPRVNIDVAARRLREVALRTAEGDPLGSEEELEQLIGVSRLTVRQAARLVERDGLITVRRGYNGGYFAARPQLDMVVSIVCAYLDAMGMDTRHVGTVSVSLWVDALREAAEAEEEPARRLAAQFSQKIEALGDDVPFEDVARLERESWTAIFELIGGRYLDLIFRLNAAFARSHIGAQLEEMVFRNNPDFIVRWKRAKLAEMDAIDRGDTALAMMAALTTRRLWGNHPPRNRRQSGFTAY